MKKRKLRTILMIMLITVFTTTSVFAINTANFKPYHNSKPITGAGKSTYERLDKAITYRIEKGAGEC